MFRKTLIVVTAVFAVTVTPLITAQTATATDSPKNIHPITVSAPNNALLQASAIEQAKNGTSFGQPTTSSLPTVGNSTPKPQPTYKKGKGKGKLTITFTNTTGLESGLPVVIVKQGKKIWKIKRARTITLPTGVVSISVPRITLPDGTLVTGYTTKTYIPIKKNKKVKINADWGNRTIVPVTSVAPSAVKGTAAITTGKADKDGFPGLPLITIPIAGKYQQGDFIEVPAGHAGFKYGFVGKVLTVNDDGSVVAEYVPLTVIYKNLQINQEILQQDINIAPVSSTQNRAKAATAENGLTCTANAAANLIESIKSVSFPKEHNWVAFDFRDGVLWKTGFSIGEHVETPIESGTYNCQLGVSIPISPVTGLVIEPSITVFSEVKASFKEGSFIVGTDIVAGFSYTNAEGPKDISGVTMTPIKVPPLDEISMDVTSLGVQAGVSLKFPYVDEGVVHGGGGAKIELTASLHGGHLAAPSSIKGCLVEKNWKGVLNLKISAGAELGIDFGPWTGTVGGYIDLFDKDLYSGTFDNSCLIVEPPLPEVKEPINVSAAAGDSSATVKWNEGDDRVSRDPIVQYLVYEYTSNTPLCTVDAPLGHCDISNLMNGKTYSFVVQAKSKIGMLSMKSAISNSVTPMSPPPPPPVVPTAPINVVAEAGNKSAGITWDAPINNGGSPITKYIVTSAPSGKTCETHSEADTTCLVKGLINGTSYTFTVVAENAAGAGPRSLKSNSVVPIAVPSQPLNVTANAGRNRVTVTWDIPLDDGATPITGYTVTSDPDGKICTTLTRTSCTITGLTNGTYYTFTVVATNSKGDSPSSEPSVAVRPGSAPGVPTFVAAHAGDKEALVMWLPPADDGGSPVTSYTVTSVPNGKTCITMDISCTVTGLVNGTSYVFTVVADNQFGTSADSEPSIAVTPRAPRVPLSVSYPNQTITRGSNSQILRPTVIGGSGTSAYTVAGNLPDGVTFNGATGVFTGPSENMWSVPPLVVGQNAISHLTDAAVAPDGSTYITGNFAGNITVMGHVYYPLGYDAFIAKISSNGAMQWFAPIGGNTTGNDSGLSLGVTPDGGVIASGFFSTNAVFGGTVLYGTPGVTPEEIFVTKLSSNGTFEWATKAGGSGQDIASSIAVASDGGAYVTGNFDGVATFGALTARPTSAADISAFVAKISSNGVWTRVDIPLGETGQIGAVTIGTDIIADSSGNVYLTGYLSPMVRVSFGANKTPPHVNNGEFEGFIAKMSSSGIWSWVSQPLENKAGKMIGAAIAPDGYIYVQGIYSQTGQLIDRNVLPGTYGAYIAKIGPSGRWAYASPVEGLINSDNTDSKIVVASNGDAIMTGSFGETVTFGSTPTLVSKGITDVYVARIAPDGTWLWAVNGGGTGQDYGTAIDVLPDGTVVSGGSFTGTAKFGHSTVSETFPSAFVSKLLPSGSWDRWDTTVNNGYPVNLTVTATDGTDTVQVPVTLQLN